ncbi:hypothetical protein [Microcoleus sp. FACHB-68]|uniref:hypothetical protein n=1 Tax=Microcoleus sp. FACHB-68 TaxID=2692826 RepID=UPI001684F80F|nr:hypothetical protein [Microcoleus sp. FACHB-68]MBD1937353.1 hypothetical protein [Microcoleus sp. FACHB-68]
MLKIPARLKKFVAMGLALLLGLVILQTFKPAQAQSGADARVSRLESEVYNLRAQISRLESQVYRLNNRAGSSASTSTTREIEPEPEYIPPRAVPDPMFSRLATLVIELKERIDGIDARLTDVENNQ